MKKSPELLNKLTPLLLAALALAPVFFTHGCANTTQAPSGGDKDTIPPVIIAINPIPGTTNVPLHGARFEFTFNEYVTIKNTQNIFLSPPMEKKPKARIVEKKLVVTFEEDLRPETTYTLSLNDAIADNNEGIMFAGYTFPFSTGDHIDSMVVTGTVLNSSDLKQINGATVLLYKDHRDSAVMLQRPYAATKTDEWGYFAIPYIQDTLYRIYAVKDENDNCIYEPETEQVAFVDSLVRPVMVVSDSLPEMLRYDMKDTLSCQARKSEYEMTMFREKPSKQYVVNKVRVSDRAAYITFMAPNAYIDSLWIGGFKPDRVITQFNIQMDSLEIWVNDRRKAPDTLHLFVDYGKTDTTGKMKISREHIKLVEEGLAKKKLRTRKDIKHEDTICVYTFTASGDKIDQDGMQLEFKYPIIYENFDSIRFTYLNTKQKEFKAEFKVEQDTMNLRRYIIRPKDKLQKGYEYNIKLPYRAFRDINGFYSDSTETKFSLPNDEEMSTLHLHLSGVTGKIIVDLQDEKQSNVIRSYITDKNTVLDFPFLKEGKYCIRITDDSNRNNIVDTGNLLEHRQPEKVRYFIMGKDNKFLDIMKSAEIDQDINVTEVFAK